MSKLTLYINGKKVTEPMQWQGIKILAAFGRNSNQPEIESDRFTLVKDAAKEVIDSVANGNIFEGLDAVLEYEQRGQTISIFNGFIDTSDNYEEIDPTFGASENPNQVSVKFRGKDTITNFTDQISGVTFGYLYDIGVIEDSDFTTINTVIVKKANFMEIAMAVIMIYLLSKQIRDTIKEIISIITDIAAHLAGGLTGSIAAVVYAAAKLIISISYAVAMIILVTKMIFDLVRLLIPPVVKNKGIQFRTMLEKVCNHYGYGFVSPINELDIYHYLPSKPHSDSSAILDGIIPLNVPTKTGIPSSGDFGYLLNEAFELCKRLFDAKVDVVGNDVHLRNVNDTYWLQSSTYVPPFNIKFPSKKFNTQELNQTRMMSFIIDPNDEWTMENYTGLSYEIKTDVSNPQNLKNIVIKGLDRTDIPLALPSNKDTLTNIEEAMILVAKVADAFSKLLFKKTTFAADIERNRLNVLKISDNDYTVAKIVPLITGDDNSGVGLHLPPNHREFLSARVLMNKYQQGRSFVTGQKLGQQVIYSGVRLPFTLADFQSTLYNGKFVLPDGRTAEFVEIPWTFSEDILEATIRVHEIYTNKLIEKTYEP